MRKAILTALVGVAMMLGGGGKAEACHKQCTCTYYTYTYPVYYYPGTWYRVWHVYQTNPVTGAAEVVKRYFTKEDADHDPLVSAKKAYVVEYMYYAA